MTTGPPLRYPSPEAEAAVQVVYEVVRSCGGRAWLVGGCVRDAALGEALHDLDIEVFGVAPDALERALRPRLPLSLVGQSFPVWKLHGLPIDVSVPRLGSVWDAAARPETAAARRDFTINAVALDPVGGERVDPFDGLGDLERGILRHTSERFGEDPLRVLRGMQLVARLRLDAAEETIALCRSLRGARLARERVFAEWSKLVVKGVQPSLGLAFLRDCGWLEHTPELAALVGCPQDPEWHPEGDVWVHTLHCMDAFADERTGEPREDLIVGLAVLCHDLGKPETTAREGERITSKRHERVGEALTRRLLERWTEEHALVDEVVPLVGAHLAPVQLHKADSSERAIRRLARRVGRIDRLVRVARADWFGRPPLPRDDFPAGRWLLERAAALHVADSPPEAIVKGRHLIELGASPGPALGALLERCYDAQIDGRFADLEGGLRFAGELLQEDERRG